MADVTKTVLKSGGDYSTVQSAIDACSTLIEAGSWYKVAIGDAANYDEDLTIPSGEIGTPTSSHYLWLTSSGAGRHDGTSGSGAVIEANSTSECVHITELDYTRISDLEFEYSGGFGGISGFLIYRTVGALISNCIVWSSNRGNIGIQIDSFTADNNSTSIDNTVVYGFERNGIQLNEDGAAAGTGNVLNLDHVSVYDCGDGAAGRGGISILTRVSGDSSTVNAYNTWATDNNNNDWFDTDNTPDETTSIGTVTWNGSHNAYGAYGKTDIDGTDNTTNWQNASNDATVTTTTANAVIVTNLTGGSEDFTPVAATGGGSNLLLENGTDRQGSEPDARQDFSTDIAGNTRPTTNVDIGAFQISTAGGGTTFGAAALTGSATLAVAPTKEAYRAAALTGSATVAVAGTRTTYGAAALTGSATLAVAGTRTTTGAAALTGSATLTVAGTRTAPGAAALTGTATLVVAGTGSGTVTGAAALTGSATVAVAGTRTTYGAAALTGSATLVVAGTGSGAVTGAAALTGSATLAVAGTRTTYGAAALTGSATLAVAGTRSTTGAAALTGSATLVVAGTRGFSTSAALTGSATLVVAGTRTAPGAAALTGTATLAVAPTRALYRAAALTGSATVTATNTTNVVAAPSTEYRPARLRHSIQRSPLRHGTRHRW